MPEFPKSKVLRSQRNIDDVRSDAETCEIPVPDAPRRSTISNPKGPVAPTFAATSLPSAASTMTMLRHTQINLFRITARREGMTLSQVYTAVGLDPPPDAECWRSDVLVLVQLQRDEEESGWRIAEHATYMLNKYGRGAATKLAREAGVSASYIRSLAITARAFPKSLRNLSLTMGHHRIAAQTESPKAWLKRAAEKKWSVREMEDTVKGRHVDDGYQAQVERLENSVQKFNEAWGTSRNIKAVLVWESLASA